MRAKLLHNLEQYTSTSAPSFRFCQIQNSVTFKIRFASSEFYFIEKKELRLTKALPRFGRVVQRFPSEVRLCLSVIRFLLPPVLPGPLDLPLRPLQIQ